MGCRVDYSLATGVPTGVFSEIRQKNKTPPLREGLAISGVESLKIKINLLGVAPAGEKFFVALTGGRVYVALLPALVVNFSCLGELAQDVAVRAVVVVGADAEPFLLGDACVWVSLPETKSHVTRLAGDMP